MSREIAFIQDYLTLPQIALRVKRYALSLETFFTSKIKLWPFNPVTLLKFITMADYLMAPRLIRRLAGLHWNLLWAAAQ